MNLRSSIYQGNNTDYYTSAGWNYRSRKLDVFGFHSFSRNKIWSKSNLTQRVEADTLWNIALDQDTYVRSMSVSNQLGMNYQIDDNNFLGFRYILGANPSSKSSNTIVSSVTANDNDFDHLTTQSHNASFTAQFDKTQLGLFYNLKTRRPSYGQLSENIYYGNRFTYQGGNPFLKQERVHSLTIMGARGFFQCSVSYTDRRNAIIYWGEPYQESTSVTLISFTNLNSLKSVSGYASLSPQIGCWWPQLTAGISKQWLGMDTRDGRRYFNTPLLPLQFSNTLELGKGWMATANMAYSSKGYSENLYMSRHIFSVNASTYKFLFDRKLTIYLSASDVFKSQKSGNNLYFYQTNTTQINRSDSREVSLTVKNNFNAAKSKYKGTGAGQGE